MHLCLVGGKAQDICVELVVQHDSALVVSFNELIRDLCAADGPVERAQDAIAFSHPLIMFFHKVWPLGNQLLKVFVHSLTHTFAVLCEVNGDGCQVGQPDTVRVLRAVLTELVAES